MKAKYVVKKLEEVAKKYHYLKILLKSLRSPLYFYPTEKSLFMDYSLMVFIVDIDGNVVNGRLYFRASDIKIIVGVLENDGKLVEKVIYRPRGD